MRKAWSQRQLKEWRSKAASDHWRSQLRDWRGRWTDEIDAAPLPDVTRALISDHSKIDLAGAWGNRYEAIIKDLRGGDGTSATDVTEHYTRGTGNESYLAERPNTPNVLRRLPEIGLPEVGDSLDERLDHDIATYKGITEEHQRTTYDLYKESVRKREERRAAGLPTSYGDDPPPDDVMNTHARRGFVRGLLRHRIVTRMGETENPHQRLQELWRLDAELSRKPSWEDKAASLGMSYDEYKKAVADNLYQHATDGRLAIRMQPRDFANVVKEGRWKTMHEVGRSRGFYDQATREKVEADLFGSPADMDPSKRAIYGYVSYSDKEEEFVNSYGGVRIIIKEDRRRTKTTITFGDSLDQSGTKGDSMWGGGAVMAPSRPFNKDTLPWSMPYNEYSTVDPLGDPRNWYVEVQYHGGLTLDDVELVEFTADLPSTALANALTKRGIVWVSPGGIRSDAGTHKLTKDGMVRIGPDPYADVVIPSGQREEHELKTSEYLRKPRKRKGTTDTIPPSKALTLGDDLIESRGQEIAEGKRHTVPAGIPWEWYEAIEDPNESVRVLEAAADRGLPVTPDLLDATRAWARGEAARPLPKPFYELPDDQWFGRTLTERVAALDERDRQNADKAIYDAQAKYRVNLPAIGDTYENEGRQLVLRGVEGRKTGEDWKARTASYELRVTAEDAATGEQVTYTLARNDIPATYEYDSSQWKSRWIGRRDWREPFVYGGGAHWTRFHNRWLYLMLKDMEKAGIA